MWASLWKWTKSRGQASHDLTRGHAFGVEALDFVVHRGKAGLVLLNQLGFKLTRTVTGNINFE